MALNANRDGQCDLTEFLQFFELPKDRFTERIFKCMDVSSTGKLDFHDFVVGLWNYCKLNVCVERERGRVASLPARLPLFILYPRLQPNTPPLMSLHIPLPSPTSPPTLPLSQAR